MISWCYDRAEIPSPSFPSEIFGMFIEALEDDQDSLRACSLVSSVFRHLCGPILYRDIALNRQGKVDTFVQFGERSDILRCAKSFTVTKSKDPHRILDTVSRKASLEILCISRVIFRPGTLTASILSRLSTVTVVILQRCQFGGFKDFIFYPVFPPLRNLAPSRLYLDSPHRRKVRTSWKATRSRHRPGPSRSCELFGRMEQGVLGTRRDTWSTLVGSHWSQVFHVRDRR